jgi:hypothetical protein
MSRRAAPARAGQRRAREVVDRLRRLERDAAGCGDLRELRAVLAAAPVAPLEALVQPARAEQRADEARVADPDAAPRAEADAHRVLEEAPEAPRLGAVRIELGHRRAEVPDRRVVGVEDQVAVLRVHRREVELERAALVVDVAVLDPRDAGDVHEPRHHADALERAGVHTGGADLGEQLGGDLGHEQLDIVVADDDVDRVPRGGEPPEVGEQRALRLADQPHALHAGLRAAVEAEAALVGGLRRSLARHRDHHRHEVEQITGDDEPPRPAVAAAHRVVAQELAERGGAELDGALALHRGSRQELFPEVQVADDQDVRGRFSHTSVSSHHAVSPPRRQHPRCVTQGRAPP